MTPDFLWAQYPYLWHMAEAGSWPSIRDYGLLSTSALLDRYEVDDEVRAAVLGERRPTGVTISRKGMPNAVIRDNIPMSDGGLRKCLQDGLTPSDWYRMLNQRTFFWVSRVRLQRLLSARAYRNRRQTILTVNTRTLVEAHKDRVELSPINSGSTIFNPVARGISTFQSIADYEYDLWRSKRTVENAIVELIVLDQVPDIRNHVIAVHDSNGGTFTEVWRRRGTDRSIGP